MNDFIKIFSNTKKILLEREVNDFLKTLNISGRKVKNIQFDTTIDKTFNSSYAIQTKIIINNCLIHYTGAEEMQ